LRFAACRGCVLLVVIFGESDERPSQRLVSRPRPPAIVVLERDGWSWLRPSVSGVALSSLLTWWTLLFGLSMLARYEPAGWMRALDYGSSELAAPLAGLLDIGVTRVPELILGALMAAPESEPTDDGAAS
jgi:hypothetical protein